jgi:hypothetical protein
MFRHLSEYRWLQVAACKSGESFRGWMSRDGHRSAPARRGAKNALKQYCTNTGNLSVKPPNPQRENEDFNVSFGVSFQAAK